MKTINKFPLTLLAKHLGQALGAEITESDLDILLFGWAKKHHFKHFKGSLTMRKRRDGFGWLTGAQVISFSDYAGYDLT